MSSKLIPTLSLYNIANPNRPAGISSRPLKNRFNETAINKDPAMIFKYFFIIFKLIHPLLFFKKLSINGLMSPSNTLYTFDVSYPVLTSLMSLYGSKT